jgi:hypothetical protein
MHEDNGHHHNHDHEHNHEESSPEQMSTMISYLVKHNEDHINDLKKWHTNAIKAGMGPVASDFRKIIKLSEKIDRYFNLALKKLKK